MRRSSLEFLVIALVLVMAFPTLFANAFDTIDPEMKVTLTVNIENAELIGENVVFELYKISGISQNTSFSLIGDFNGYPVRIDTDDSTDWAGAAATLYGYVKYDNISPMYTAVLGGDGKIVFDTEGMINSEYDMTLFTCTKSGRQCFTVRLQRYGA